MPSAPVLVVLNFAADRVTGEIDLGERARRLRNILTSEQQVAVTALPLTFPGHAYTLYAVEAEMAAETSGLGQTSERRLRPLRPIQTDQPRLWGPLCGVCCHA